jgi:hypothetical protein
MRYYHEVTLRRAARFATVTLLELLMNCNQPHCFPLKKASD